MPPGKEVCLGSGDIMLDGDPYVSPMGRGTAAPLFGLCLHCVSEKSSHLLTVHNFVKSLPIFKICALLESVRNLL